MNGKAGLEGTFLGPSILQGRILGQNLAKLAGQAGASERPPAGSGQKEDSAPRPARCQSCHLVDKLVAASRKGYWHFEQVHRVVLDRGWDCAACHTEMLTFVPARHKTNAVEQIAACSRCHLSGE